ncbi:MAG: UDP-N-acetylmuramoyl-L-alanyl-D-glutamate--2,6-diaminopimelate ligase [Euzebya sp.]
MTDSFTPAQVADSLPDAVLLPRPSKVPQAVLTDVTHDSRQAGPGVLFAARPGAHVDGHDFAAAAVKAGSPALLVQRALPKLKVPQIQVTSVADSLGFVADLIHGSPTADIDVLGITGTNGKTTTAYLLDAVWRAAGRVTGLIGTVETRIGDQRVPGVRTTPEASDLHRLFARMRDQGVTAASIEVSSHGLALGRLNGVRLAAALFTNLTQDHLDFHTDMEEYYLAKASLFTPTFTPVGVITVDDDYGRRLAEQAPVDVWTLSRRTTADVTATDVVAGVRGSTFLARVKGARVGVRINLPGEYNVANALGAIATAHAAGVPLSVAADGLASLTGVPGRMERVDVGQPFGVLVDYAHTPDSVVGVLDAARTLTDGRLIVVLGCGGDRDRRKRPVMARAAVSHADIAVFTNDNPRSEDPEAILQDMIAGLADPRAAIRITDRRDAIGQAIGMARAGDVVVIAGKGHEPYQELADGRIDFDDRVIARQALTRWVQQ